MKTDLVKMSMHNCGCGECAKHQNRVYSISGNDKRFPKLPDVVMKTGSIHNGCRHSFSPYYYFDGNTITVGVRKTYDSYWTYEEDVIKHSNRPFVDDRESWEVARYERNNAEIYVRLKDYKTAIYILVNVKESLYFELPESEIIDLDERINLTTARHEYALLCDAFPDVVPKSISGYLRMKKTQSKNWLKLVEAARTKGIDIHSVKLS